MKIVAVDPRRVGIAAQADVLLQVRPGTDGALALAMIDVAITEKLFDDSFVRQWTNGTFLIRLDTGAALTEADLTASGSADRFVAWDEIANVPILYDSLTGGFEGKPDRLSIAGARTVVSKDGSVNFCEPALLAWPHWRRNLHQRSHRRSPGYRPTKFAKRCVCWRRIGRSVCLCTMALASIPTRRKRAGRSRRSYALFGDIDRQGGNVVFPKAPLNAMSGKEFLAKETALQRIGRERKPLGPPAKPGNCAAYDIFTAVLEGRPYPVKALLNFGSNTDHVDWRLAKSARSVLRGGISRSPELFMTPTAELCDYVLPATSFLEMATVSNDFKHREQGRRHVQYRPAVVAPLAERRSDTWMVFELAKRLGFADDFWQGDIDAAYEQELAPAGITLSQLKASPGGITIPATPRYQKFATPDKSATPRGFNTRIKKVAVYLHAFAAYGFAALPEYIEPMVSPVSRPDVAKDYPLVLTNAKFTTYIHSQLRGLTSLRKVSPHPSADIHPETAKRYGITDKNWMVIESPRDSIRESAGHRRDRARRGVLPARLVARVQGVGAAGLRFLGAGSANPSLLIGSDIADPISGSLPHRSFLCRVRPAP